ncbi:GCFC-domain-containing protein [Lentinus tigrinus ALCF2SS1-7]|uniref:GCFC-domain-containing protein n=1 Tax=Lentinus tigrinus ALCF2SS1-6 TaxID=1328759 RepID=A0A5C2SHB7_9APHY|nr:GCFC-domain-containing protein [Lentinus tigrinus ALCF2SS1-6]RPD77592.1 GCFC-domain-containing protein [Lentinus tigrinus ALCF2SS1-7]
MAESPVMFKRTKPKHTQRARISTPDAEAAPTIGEEAEVEETPSAVAAKLKKKSRAKTKSTLSFGGDEEEGDGEAFKLKKSKLSKKLQLGKSSIGVPPSAFEPTLARPSTGPTYDAAYLSQLKASTPSARPTLPIGEAYDADVSMDVDSPSQMSALSTIAGTAIPSASSILAAKEKRDRLRKSTAGEDYISLSLTKRDDFSQGPHPESRLMREEDELGDADDEFAEYTSAQERIALGRKSRKKEAQKRRLEINEMIVDAEEEDEETQEWEQEQLRRGGLRPESAEPAPKPVYKPASIPPVTHIPTMAAAIARLTQSMSELTTSHAEHSAAMSKLGEEQRILEAREKEMRDMIAKAEEKRSWFSAFREWVESVATFLDEKFPPLERLEDEHLSIMKERADMIATRRRAEDEDDLMLFLGTPPSLRPQSEEVDELGRAIPSANSPQARANRTAAREARRVRRRAVNQQARQEEEGFSTDAELPQGDEEDYRIAMGRLLSDAKEIMADVKAEEFRDPTVGLGKWFGEWRTKFSDIYTGAWGGLGMVGAWEFWVRLEILGWNPVERPRSLDSFSWYKSLYIYSRPSEADEEEEPELGPDGDLVSAMITTALIPRFCRILEGGGLDAYSASDIRRLVDLMEEIEISVDKQNQKFELLLKSVHTVFSEAVEATETTLAPFLELNQPRFDPAAIPARRRFLTRRYKLLRNLLQWRKYAGDRYGLGTLATRLVGSSMMPVAESGWEVGGEDTMRKVAQALPPELVPPSLRQLRAA